MLTCSEGHGEDPTAGTHYHRLFILLKGHNLSMPNTIFVVQTIRTCNCSEGKAIMLLSYSSEPLLWSQIFMIPNFDSELFCNSVVSRKFMAGKFCGKFFIIYVYFIKIMKIFGAIRY